MVLKNAKKEFICFIARLRGPVKAWPCDLTLNSTSLRGGFAGQCFAFLVARNHTCVMFHVFISILKSWEAVGCA